MDILKNKQTDDWFKKSRDFQKNVSSDVNPLGLEGRINNSKVVIMFIISLINFYN